MPYITRSVEHRPSVWGVIAQTRRLAVITTRGVDSTNSPLAVALQPWEEFSPHAVAAREAAVALAHGSGAQLSVLSVYDYDDKQPEALSLSPETLSLSSEDLARYRDTQMVRMDELMGTKMQAFLASAPTDLDHAAAQGGGSAPADRRHRRVRSGGRCLVMCAHSQRSFLDVLGADATASAATLPVRS